MGPGIKEALRTAMLESIAEVKAAYHIPQVVASPNRGMIMG